MQRQAKIYYYSVLGNNRKFDWKFELLRRTIFDDNPREHTETINGKSEDSFNR